MKTKAEVDAAYSEEPLAPADVHLLLIEARLAARASNDEAEAWLRSELHDLILEEPLQPVALAWRAELGLDSPLAGLRKATERLPADWRGWLLLGQALDSDVEKAAAYRMAVKLKPDSALALQSLALFLATHGEPAEALRFAKQSLEIAPWDAQAPPRCRPSTPLSGSAPRRWRRISARCAFRSGGAGPRLSRRLTDCALRIWPSSDDLSGAPRG